MSTVGELKDTRDTLRETLARVLAERPDDTAEHARLIRLLSWNRGELTRARWREQCEPA